MIQMKDILHKFRDVVLADTALSAWTQSKYGTDPTVFVGLDLRDPPGAKHCPLVILQPGPTMAGQEESAFDFAVTLDWGIVNEEIVSVGNLVEITGIGEMDDMGALLWDGLTGNVSPNIALSKVSLTPEPNEFFPMIVGSMDILISVPHILGPQEITL